MWDPNVFPNLHSGIDKGVCAQSIPSIITMARHACPDCLTVCKQKIKNLVVSVTTLIFYFWTELNPYHFILLTSTTEIAAHHQETDAGEINHLYIVRRQEHFSSCFRLDVNIWKTQATGGTIGMVDVRTVIIWLYWYAIGSCAQILLVQNL